MTTIQLMAGSITPHGDRWRLRVTIAGVRKSLGLYDSREEAEEALAAVLARIGPQPGGRTLRSWGRTWLDDRELAGYHRALDQDRFEGEWFEPTQELMELVDELRDIWGTAP